MRLPRCNEIALACIGVVLCLAPLPLGSTHIVFIALWNILLCAGCLFIVPGRFSRNQTIFLGAAFVALAAYLIAIHEQIAPHPWFSESLKNPIWDQANRVLGERSDAILSVVRDAPVAALGAELAFFLIFAISFTLSVERQAARRVLRIAATAGGLYAVLAIISFIAEPGKILFWRTKTDHLGFLTGSFTNRNTAAVFFGQCAILWMLHLCEELRGSGSQAISSDRLFDRLIARPTRRTLFSLGMVGMLICTVLMTGSRAGSILSLGALSVAVLAYFWRDFVRWKTIVSVLTTAGLVAIGLILVLGGSVGGRFGLQGLSDEGRWPVYRATSRIVSDFPWLGTGLGTFSAIFPAYRPSDLSSSGIWTRAHNVLLEFASDVGLPITLIILLFYLVVISCLVWGILRRPTRDPLPAAAGLAAALLAGAHSLVDFSLQIPGYSLTAAAIIGAGIARVLSRPATEPRGHKLVSEAGRSPKGRAALNS